MTEPGSDEVAVLFSSVFGMGMFNCSVICAAAAVIMLELGAWASALYIGGVGALALSMFSAVFSSGINHRLWQRLGIWTQPPLTEVADR